MLIECVERTPSRGQQIYTLDIPATRCSVRDLIALRVSQGIELAPEPINELPFPLIPRCMPAVDNVEVQTQRAWRAFEARQYFVLAGKRQLERLDDIVELSEDLDITFIRLIPLVGG